jgi:HrpA-like RNA helicase
MTIAATQINENCCISNASRVSTEQNVTLGTKVGFSIPFEKNYAGYSGIVYMTNEMLLDELCTDPLLSCYSIIIIDDVHERTIFQDVLLGATKKYVF